jgi:hypothetical protein
MGFADAGRASIFDSMVSEFSGNALVSKSLNLNFQVSTLSINLFSQLTLHCFLFVNRLSSQR